MAGKVEDKSMQGLKVTGLLFGALLIATLPANAHVRFAGGIAVVPAIGPWGWYNPYFVGVYPPIYPGAGELRLKTNVKDADVFINGAYAGKAEKLKSVWLRADSYNLEVRAPGRAPFAEQIYVTPGKTVKVDAEFASVPRS
jgi:hypothetical protein